MHTYAPGLRWTLRSCVAPVSSILRVCTEICPVPSMASTAFSKIFVNACCTFASSKRATYNSRSNCTFHVICPALALRKNSIQRCMTAFRLPGGVRRVCFSCWLNMASSFAISAAREAAFSTSISECRHGCPGSALLNTNDVWPRMLVSALLKSSDIVRASCRAQSSFCLSASPESVGAFSFSAGDSAGAAGATGSN